MSDSGSDALLAELDLEPVDLPQSFILQTLISGQHHSLKRAEITD